MYGGLTEGIFEEYLGLIGGGKESLEQWERQIAAQVDIPDGASLVVINANPFTLGHLQGTHCQRQIRNGRIH